jgi:hypothetical protein
MTFGACLPGLLCARDFYNHLPIAAAKDRRGFDLISDALPFVACGMMAECGQQSS